MICPLGLCRVESECPNAPCVECMRRLGDHMIEEVRIMQGQANAARAKGECDALNSLRTLLGSLGLAITVQEMTSDASALNNQDPHGQEHHRLHATSHD